MNVRDSEVICGLLEKEGHKITDEPDTADVILFNTCSVRQHAEDKVWSEIGRIAKLGEKKGTFPKKRGQSPFLIGGIGCMAQNYKEGIFERSPLVDFVVGPSDIGKIPEIIKKFIVHSSELREDSVLERKIWETAGEGRPDEIYHSGYYEDKEHAYVVISEGCSNFCSYCVVPYVRGALRNRDHQNILKEIEEAAGKGITKITLLGQNVNAYKSSSGVVDFPELLKLVNGINEIKEFGFITSHPKDTTEELFRVMADLKKLKKYLHLPIQSGSDRILKLMNRGYAKKMYLDLIENYRKMLPQGVLTTDIILGYPSETEEDFQETRDLVREARFNAAFIFKYSARPGTKAWEVPDDVPQKEKERRHRVILNLQKKISMGKK